MISYMDTEYYRQIRREAQRKRRANEHNQERNSRRKNDSDAHRIARDLLSVDDRTRIRFADTSARASVRNTTYPRAVENWWDRVVQLNSCQTMTPVGLGWNRV
jgi:hypothetical protein